MGIFKRGENWYLDYYAGSRRIREKVGPAKGEAKAALDVRKAEMRLGKFGLLPKTSIPSFEAFAERYKKRFGS